MNYDERKRKEQAMSYTEKKLRELENTLQGVLYLLTQTERCDDVDIMEMRSRVCKSLAIVVDLRCVEAPDDDDGDADADADADDTADSYVHVATGDMIIQNKKKEWVPL